MREHLFEDSIDMPNVQEPISLGSLVDAQQTRESLEGKHICPYCGAVNDSASGPCPNCSLENTPAGRKATKSRIGPWYVLQRRNPAAPGMKYDMLLNFVRKGRVKPRTVVRGPTTHQLWRFAAHVKGLSREFGLCYSCGEKIEQTCTVCPQCNRLQLPPLNPDALLETGDAESPPGALPLTSAAEDIAATNGSDHGQAPESPTAAPDQAEANHDIVVPALTDAPAEPAPAGADAEPARAAAGNRSTGQPLADGPPAEAAGVGHENELVQSMSLATIGMPTPLESPIGARARSAALKAGGFMGGSPAIAGMGGPRIMPLAAGGASPAPLLTADGPPIAYRGSRSRWRGGAEIVLFLVVLVGALGGGMLLVDSSLREWVQTTYNRVLKGAHLKSDTDQPMSDDQPDPSLGMTHGSPTPSPGSSGVPSLASSDITPKPAAVRAPVPPAPPAPSPTIANNPVPTSDTPAPAPNPGDSTQSESDRERALYRAAKMAQGAGDFATAVKDYQLILKMPADLRQTDVESNLRYAERLVKSATH